jgi:hypothetical protein
MFTAGHMPTAANRAQRGPKKTQFSYTTVRREFLTWQQARAREEKPPTAPKTEIASAPSDGQLTLLFNKPATVQGVDAAASEADLDDAPATLEGGTEIMPMASAPVRGGQMVQHVGCWLLLALANEFGLHADACYAFTQQQAHAGLRIAIEAVLCSLALGQRCIEGVRRLATPTGPTLLRAVRVPTAPGVRKLFRAGTRSSKVACTGFVSSHISW